MFPLIVCDAAYWLWVRISCGTDFPWAFAKLNQQPLLRKTELAPSFAGLPQGCPESQHAPPLPPLLAQKQGHWRDLLPQANPGENEWGRWLRNGKYISSRCCMARSFHYISHFLHIGNRHTHFQGWDKHTFIKAMHFSLYPLNELRNLATKNYSHLTACIQAPFRKRVTGYCSTAHLNHSPCIAAINSERVIKFTVIFKRACMHVKTNPFSANRSSHTMLHLYATLVAFVFCSGEVCCVYKWTVPSFCQSTARSDLAIFNAPGPSGRRTLFIPHTWLPVASP